MNLGPGIIMDILTVGILLLSTFYGARKGFILTVISFIQWFVCIIIGMFFCSKASSFLADNTAIDDMIGNQIAKHIETTIEESSAYQALPDLFGNTAHTQASDIAAFTSDSITSIIMTVLGFLTVVLAIKAVCFLFAHLFSKKYNEGITGFFDGVLGFLFGIGRGLLLILIFYAVLVPLLGILWPGLTDLTVKAINDSYIASLFYNDNMLLVLVRDFFS